jgi:signal transduction histidine kinase
MSRSSSNIRWDRLVDAGVAAFVLWFTLAQFFSDGFDEYTDVATDQDGLGFALCLLVAVPVFFRRTHPWPVFALTMAGGVALPALGYGVHANLGPAVMLFTFASAPDRGNPVLPIAFAAAGYALQAVFQTAAVGFNENDFAFNVEDYILPAVVWTGAWLVGDRQRTRSLRAAEAEIAQAREQRLRIAEERTRIARDLHDSAGHAINNVLVQAGAARLLHERDPERSRRAIEAIEQVARETLDDIDRIVAALREGEPAERAPLPGTEAIPALVDRHRDAGLAFELVVRGDPGRALPSAVERAAYRIAQEALTNAAQHGAGSAEIVVDRGPSELTVTVTNPIADGAPGRTAGGLGLVGMRERAGLLGGTFEATAEDGRFRVRATLPYDRATLPYDRATGP